MVPTSKGCNGAIFLTDLLNLSLQNDGSKDDEGPSKYSCYGLFGGTVTNSCGLFAGTVTKISLTCALENVYKFGVTKIALP